jgi:hypothetical protein
LRASLAGNCLTLRHLSPPPQNRFKQMLETAQKQRAEIAAELDKVQSDIAVFETG